MDHAVQPDGFVAMNVSLPQALSRALPTVMDEDVHRLRQLRTLISLLALYAAVLLVVMLLSDGPVIGCILAGIAGHVLYASVKTALAWREAAWLEAARARLCRQRATA